MGADEMRRFGITLASVSMLAACREQPAPPSTDTGVTAPRVAPSTSVAPSASVARPPLPEPTRAPASDAAPAPVGGNWLKCYANFQPRTDPARDVLRLGLMCGPSNGLRKVTDAREAELADGGSSREHRFAAQAGDCYRLFAVGEPSVEDLDVEVFDPRGARIAWDTTDDRWPVVKPDGPFCVMQDGEYRAIARAQRGAGSYALEIWRLR